MAALKYAVNLLTYDSAGFDITSRRDMEGIFDRLKGIGYGGVEPIGIPEKFKQLKEVAELADSYQLELVMITGAWGRFGGLVGTYPEKDPTSSNPRRKKDAIEYIRKCCDMAATFNSPYMLIALGSLEPQDLSESGVNRARRNLVEVLKKASRHAEDAGVKLIFEPQCRFEGYYGVNSTVSQALRVVKEVNSDNVVLIVDTFHANIEETSIPKAIRSAGKLLSHVHSSDSNRLPPGMGGLDFKPIVRELLEMGYGGYLSLECVPARPDPDPMVERGLGYLKAIESLVRMQMTRG